jgi:glycosyl transferase, family 25
MGGNHITPADLPTYVVNLRRRADRRARMRAILPAQLRTTFTSDWADPLDPFDGHLLDRAGLQANGYGLFPWQICSDNPWWSRPLKLGEIGCTLAHWACWQHAYHAGDEPYVLMLEDDAVLAPNFLDQLLHGLRRIAHRQADLVYLGRYPLGPHRDQPAQPGFVVPAYSHCTFGYLLGRHAVGAVLATRLDQAIVPVDEFLPALYIDHPRADLRIRFPRQLSALAFEPPLVHQLPKEEAGSDTEDSAFVEGAVTTARSYHRAAINRPSPAIDGRSTPTPASAH